MFDYSETREITLFDIGDVDFSCDLDLTGRINNVLEAGDYAYGDLGNADRLKILSALLSRCRLCRLAKTGFPVVPSIASEPRLLAIGRNPNKADASLGSLFESNAPASRLFNKYLDLLRMQRRNVTVLNCCNCHSSITPPQPSDIRFCREWMHLYLSAIDLPGVILLMGDDAVKAFLGDGFPSLASSFGVLLQANIRDSKKMIIPMYHPAHVIARPEFWPDVKKVLGEASRRIDLMQKSA